MQTEQNSTEQTQGHAIEAETDHIESAFQSDDTQEVETGNNDNQELNASEQSQENQEKWPKKAENALARQKRENAKLRQREQFFAQQMESLKAEIEKIKSGSNKGDAAPREEDFESYSDFIEAKAIFKAEQKFKEKMQEQSQSQQEAMKRQNAEMQRYQRMEQVSVQAKKLAEQIPDLAEVIQNSGADDLPVSVQNLLLSARNPSLAAYNLAKEGILEQLAYMPVHMASAEIVRAQSQMPQFQQQQTKTTQFKPMRGVSGSNGGKSGINAASSWNEMSKWLES